MPLCRRLSIKGKLDYDPDAHCDHHMAIILDDHKSAVVETMAVSELLKKQFNVGKKANLTFFRDSHGFEVDIIADWKHTFAIEVKSSSETERKMSAKVTKYVSWKDW